MRFIAITLLISSALLASGNSRANVCSIPGSAKAWATDQCLLETGESDPNSKPVLDCLAKANPIAQPCEWNALFKQAYCAVLIARNRLPGTVETCVKNPDIRGPTVRQMVQGAG